MQFNGIELFEWILPCWAYALRRVNKSYWCSFEKQMELIREHLRVFDPACVKPGDILLWKIKDGHTGFQWNPVGIDATGRTIFTNVSYEFHVGVLEHDGLVSDLSVYNNMPPDFRFRRMSELTTPDYYIATDSLE